ncbi:MAG TPA: hypothetical protein VGM39_10565 [Kofleriaceae bacterium]|jgi:hypothetical protein
MANLHSDIQRLVDTFVAEVTDLARRAAMDTLASAFNGGRGGRVGGGSMRLGRGRGAKRSSGELDQLAEQFAAYVNKNPGLRIEQINKELGTTTKDLQLPIRKMIAEGSLKVKGKKRSTQYFPGSKKN